MEKAIKDLSNCLDGSTEFLKYILEKELVKDHLLIGFIEVQIASNEMTIKEYNNK